MPFNPETAWKAEPAEVPRPWRRGWLVKGTLNGRAFEGWIGFRWGRFFLIVDEDLQRAAKVSAGDEVLVVVEPRRPSRAAGPRSRKG